MSSSPLSSAIPQSLTIAIIFDIFDVALYYMTMFFNIIVITNLWLLQHPAWSGCMIFLVTW